MDNQTAYDELVYKAYSPVFFTKLAQVYGINPATHDEAVSYLNMAGKLHKKHEEENVKSAHQRVDVVTEANQALDKLLGEYSYDNSQAGVSTDYAKEAAAEAFKNPEIKEAALQFSSYLSQ